MWRTRIGFYVRTASFLPDFFSADLGLPSVEEHYGEACLRALAQLEETNLLSAYEGTMELLFGQLRLEDSRESATAG